MYCLTYFVENRDTLGYFFSVPVVVVMQDERESVCVRVRVRVNTKMRDASFVQGYTRMNKVIIAFYFYLFLFLERNTYLPREEKRIGALKQSFVYK